MSATGLNVFDKTLHTTNTWLGEMEETLGPDRQIAWHALGAVLRTVRDRLPLGLATNLGAQLPMLVRGTYYDQWRPSEQPADWSSLDSFLSNIDAKMDGTRPVNPKDTALSVFKVLNHHVEPGQVEKVRESLPEEVRRLWSPDNAEIERNIGASS